MCGDGIQLAHDTFHSRALGNKPSGSTIKVFEIFKCLGVGKLTQNEGTPSN
jgi:hypothetical protein